MTFDPPPKPRTSARYAVSIEATLYVQDLVVACGIANLSLGGALILTSTELHLDSSLRLLFVLPVVRETVDALATVRWTAPKAVGVQFGGLRAREVWALGKFLSTLRVRSVLP